MKQMRVVTSRGVAGDYSTDVSSVMSHRHAFHMCDATERIHNRGPPRGIAGNDTLILRLEADRQL